jgi:hypothetical protein
VTRAEHAVSDELTARVRAGENPFLVRLHNDGGSLEVFQAMVEDLDRSVGDHEPVITMDWTQPCSTRRSRTASQLSAGLELLAEPSRRLGRPGFWARHPKSR